LNPKYLLPQTGVSILVSSYNTNINFVNECLDTIKHQQGHFQMELVWINDGSDEEHTMKLKQTLDRFSKTTRFTNVVYRKNDTNKGLGYCMAIGVELCSHELIFRMDSDDCMYQVRIEKQLAYMNSNPDCVICGTQTHCFNTKNEVVQVTNHPSVITLESYKANPSHWFLNHPSVCFRKSAVLAVGNYDRNIHSMIEDFDLWLRLLKKYGKIHNMPDVLLNYRIHENQLTFKGGEKGPEYWHKKRLELIQNIIG